MEEEKEVKLVVDNLSKVIKYSLLGQKLRIEQLYEFNKGFKYGKGIIKILPFDIFYYISKLVKKNSWEKAMILLNK